ncbi:T9SS type A sorting domain-containing protein [Taibaiella koreensis]|uniref:T9SS type A sorting domain-containing protein n=1 Tax=Taibaiella koreensis TaxID=1268548 RepID=UPI0013C327A1|nr:T9SS type A sorting domain-containing protein [Taibaiella koreensis]
MSLIQRFLFLLLLATTFTAGAQEHLGPLMENTALQHQPAAPHGPLRKPTALALPFFEDFTDNAPYPSAERWTDRYVYINNTMGRDMVSRGVATFDALNALGHPYYDTVSNYTTIYADSLTSLPFALSGRAPVDSVYLSFFYQPRGNGFSPKPYDSLMLFFLRSNGTWVKVWSVNGDTAQLPFRQVMIPLNDTGYFNDNFRMRWINTATIGISNSHWNLDYIRVDAGRNLYDTTVRDVAFTKEPASILNDFSAMPFRHFKTNPASFLAANLVSTLKNYGPLTPNIPTGFRATTGATNLGSGTANVSLPSRQETDALYPMYNAGTFTPGNPNDRVVYDNLFYCTGSYPGESRANDTIRSQQVFDNYFAYDDGTAEQSYFLNLQPGAPGATAVEYAVYQPDTLRGIAIRFAPVLPKATLKEFSIGVYRDIAINGGTDDLLYQEEFLLPDYPDTVNKFSVYAFEQPVLLNTGTFYISIVQPAGGVSDSLQIALDANRTGANHRYFKVSNNWEPSLLDGALLLRPLLGARLPVGIKATEPPAIAWSLSPNPANDRVHIHIPRLGTAMATYTLTDVQGKNLLIGSLKADTDIDISSLAPGMYFVNIHTAAGLTQPAKLIKR